LLADPNAVAVRIFQANQFHPVRWRTQPLDCVVFVFIGVHHRFQFIAFPANLAMDTFYDYDVSVFSALAELSEGLWIMYVNVD
jgi:hypothetical protein